MERRNFLRSLLGVAAATALPSEIWPFRKIFVPPAPQIFVPEVLPPLSVAAVEAIELEIFAKNIPDLIYRDTPMYNYFKKSAAMQVTNVNARKKEITFQSVPR